MESDNVVQYHQKQKGKFSDTDLIAIIQEMRGKKTKDIVKILVSLGMPTSSAYRRYKDLMQKMNSAAPASIPVNPNNAFDPTLYIPDLHSCEHFTFRGHDADIEDAFLAGLPVFLFGVAGTGKSESVRYLAARMRRPFLRLSFDAGLGMDDFIGQINVTNGTTDFTESILLQLIQYPCIVLFDEINSAPDGVLFKLHEMLDSRRVYVSKANRGQGKLYEVHPEVGFFLAGNPAGGKYAGARKMNFALINRCCCIFMKPFSAKELESIIQGINPRLKGSLIQFYEAVQGMANQQSLPFDISLRNVHYFVGLYNQSHDVKVALNLSFVNPIKFMAGEDAGDAVFALARGIFEL